MAEQEGWGEGARRQDHATVSTARWTALAGPTLLPPTTCEHAPLQELRTIFLINCGATEDVRAICQFPPDNDCIRLVIIDSHRPVNHVYNDDNSATLVLLERDDPVPKEDVPEYRDGDGELREGAGGGG